MAILAGNNFNVRDFSPALWLDAADSNTLFDAVSGGALVGAGGAVARWEDKSGNSRHATQATLANRPLRTVGAQNTRDALTFDGVNDFLQILTGLNMLRNVTGATGFCVWKYNVVPISGNFVTPFFVCSGTVLGNGRLSMGTNIGTTKIFAGGRRLDADALQRVDSIINVNTTPFVQTAVLDYANSDIFQFINGSLQGSSTSFHTNGNTSDTDSINIHIGSHTGASNFANINIAEIIVFPTALSTAQRQSIERYLANKWGLGFNPLSLSPSLWLDASDSNTLYDATTGGALVGAGGAVARWEDKSGNARHATQATLANRPLRTAAAQGGRDALRFDGIDDFLSYASSLFSYTGAATIFAVTKNIVTEVNGYGSVLAEYSSSRNSIGCQINRFPNSEFRPCTDVFAPGGMEYGSNLIAADPHIIMWSWSNWSTHISNSQTVIRVDGVNGSLASYGQSPLGFTSTVRSIGRFESLSLNANHLAFDLCEIIALPYAVTIEQYRIIERYLAQKWNIMRNIIP